MIEPKPEVVRPAEPGFAGADRRVWGMTPRGLHDLLWESRGVTPVRRGADIAALRGPRRFLLVGEDEWALPGTETQGSCERVEIDDAGTLARVVREYGGAGRVAVVTKERARAAAWARGETCDAAAGDSGVRVRRAESEEEINGVVVEILRELSASGVVPEGVRRVGEDVWAHATARIARGARMVGPVWVGRDARIGAGETVVGACVVPDGSSAASDRVTATTPFDRDAVSEPGRTRRVWGDRCKRAFDIAASVGILAATAPVSAVVAAGILISDGRPVFFFNERQTLGGRTFRCLKFRTMRRDAEAVRSAVAAGNTCDGPQFHIPDDPRTFAFGRAIRRCHLDEIPQLINVVRGDMSIVGPRPSPDDENQCCPAWREARLSVRAGITGLWQVRCKRLPGTDFQEWVRYDMEYVRGRSWRMDLAIMCRTACIAAARGAGMFKAARGSPGAIEGEAALDARARGVVEAKPGAARLEEAAQSV